MLELLAVPMSYVSGGGALEQPYVVPMSSPILKGAWLKPALT
jgi:hypothetical protein